MVEVPQNKIRLIGKPGIRLHEDARVCLSAYIKEGLLYVALHLCGGDIVVGPTMIELDSISPRVLEAPLDLFLDVVKLKPKDKIIVIDPPATVDELKNTLAEIAFVRSLRLMQIQCHEHGIGRGEINCALTLGKSGSVSLKKHTGFEGFGETLNGFLGQFYIVPK